MLAASIRHAGDATAGAVLVNYAKTFLTGALPEVWLYALGAPVGALFVLVAIFPPRGLMGLVPAAAKTQWRATPRPWRPRCRRTS